MSLLVAEEWMKSSECFQHWLAIGREEEEEDLLTCLQQYS